MAKGIANTLAKFAVCHQPFCVMLAAPCPFPLPLFYYILCLVRQYAQFLGQIVIETESRVIDYEVNPDINTGRR